MTWSSTFSAGSYRFSCDPHNDFMNGSFTVGSGPPPPPPPPPPSGERVLTGFVGPGYDIGLRDASGNEVNGREIPAGSYRIEIYDYSSIHNFELKGDNFDEETEVYWTGHVTWHATFNPGEEYEYECDPHHHLLYGEFRIGDGSATASPPPPPPPPATATAATTSTGPPPPPPPPQSGGTLYRDGSRRRDDRAAPRRRLAGDPGRSPAVHDPGRTTRRASHNFHLTARAWTTPPRSRGAATITWKVTLSAGTYTFQCDPHNEFMRGSFTVADGPAPPPPPHRLRHRHRRLRRPRRPAS